MRRSISMTLCGCAWVVLAACVGEVDGQKYDPEAPLCEATFDLSGTFTQEAPQPPDVFGCWPVGTWRFSAAVKKNGCEKAPALEPSYAFRVQRDVDGFETYAYLNNPNYTRVHMKTTSGGGGLCAGSFEVFTPDGKDVLILKPALQADKSINGFAEFGRYREDRWVPGED